MLSMYAHMMSVSLYDSCSSWVISLLGSCASLFSSAGSLGVSGVLVS